MDKKALIQALLWATVAFLLYMAIAQRLLGPPQADRPAPPAATQPGPATTTSGPASGPAATGSTTGPAIGESRESPEYRAEGSDEDEPAVIAIGNVDNAEESPYRMRLELTSRGAAIESATVTDFAESVGESERYRLLAPQRDADGGPLFSLAVENVNINGHDVGKLGSLADAKWGVPEDPGEGQESAAFAINVVDADGKPTLRLTRAYRLEPQPVDKGRYDVSVDQTVENLTDQTLNITLTERGPVGIRQEYSRADSRYVYSAVVSPDDPNTANVDGTQFKNIGGADDKMQILFKRQEGSRFWWLGAGNKYFSCVIVPLTTQGQEGPDYVEEVQGVDLDGNVATAGDVTARLVSGFALSPGASRQFVRQCYIGPNDKKAFTRQSNPDYVRRGFPRIIALQYGWCAFGWLTDAMILFLDGLYRVVRNYGVAIIILVLVVRVLLHPVTKKGQVNMVRMQERMGKLQPKIEQVKERFGNDKARLQQETMKLYQEEGINPATSMLSSCLPMFIQMPIWIALYTSLSNNIHMRHEPFFLWIHDLTAPDALITFSRCYKIPLLGALTGEICEFNLLPILMGITMYLQQKLMPKPKPPPQAAKSPQMDQAAQMQKMMPIMSVFFVLILYAMPSGLNLYIMTSSLFGMIEQRRIRQHIKEAKEKSKQDLPLPARSKGPAPPKKPSWFVQKFQELQKQAEEAQRVKSRRKR
ncbi:MAG: YidC/Oxa1 family insertase periplasmic-domain containing protein [Phycisphaerales bacterium]|nr:MAG: YidC/Oxa1 family insertase periplasmic-domain containing protein [Phycisphaerales bacterium]